MQEIRRTQFLMEPDEFRRLKAEARRRKKSIEELIRAAVRQVYFTDSEADHADRLAAVEDLAKMNIPLSDWKEVKKEIESRFDEQPR